MEEMYEGDGDDDYKELEFDLQCLQIEDGAFQLDDFGDALPDDGLDDYVYDEFADGSFTTKFVAGSLVKLPRGSTHVNKTQSEEVTIPPSDNAPMRDNKPVKISSLDQVGQLAFKGMKTLNRIQSVVFDTAYNKSENLLICAPTGAGKTNIAMLTILHEARKHLNARGAVKHNEFKVVYVAPMKALAAEMTRTFGSRLKPLGFSVRELTGDVQLTKKEMMDTHMLVTTPEKWDVVTRKSVGDVALTQLVKLLIIDEVHLLHEDRGAVIESLVARTLRQVESYQNNIRIVGLSATLPNYKDVAKFLHVNLKTGLFYFDGRFRPVPLQQTYIGVAKPARGGFTEQRKRMDGICYEKVRDLVDKGHQVMVFVFARNATVKSANDLLDRARLHNDTDMFKAEENEEFNAAREEVQKSRNRQLKDLFDSGFSIHHAGMLRQDRNLVERYFAAGLIKVLCCTSTLAWGVNLPAHAVIIKGTQFYNPDKSKFEDIGILDVLQIFGRAGRPQYDTFGEGYIITSHDKLVHYLELMMDQTPIESQFIKRLEDNLNAEVVLGTVSNVKEAVRWLSYTYMHVRKLATNKLLTRGDPDMKWYREQLIKDSAQALHRAKMVVYDKDCGTLDYTEIGRIASHFYIKQATILLFNASLKLCQTPEEILLLVSMAAEFKQVKVRKEEEKELEQHRQYDCEVHVSAVKDSSGKVNVLLQTYISGGILNSFSLVSDTNYVAQNSARIMRALFEIALHEGRPQLASNVLTLTKCIDQQMWSSKNPLRQLQSRDCNRLLNVAGDTFDNSRLATMTSEQIGDIVHEFEHEVSKPDRIAIGTRIKQAVKEFPRLLLDATVQPLSTTVLQIRLKVTPDFVWNDRLQGYGTTNWWLWIEDSSAELMYHHEFFSITRQQVLNTEEQEITMTIPVSTSETLPAEINVKVVSDSWLGAETNLPLSLTTVVLPREKLSKFNVFRQLKPGEEPKVLPKTTLQNFQHQQMFPFDDFNRFQRVLFSQLHTNADSFVFSDRFFGFLNLGFQSGQIELAIFDVLSMPNPTPRELMSFNLYNVVYIAPLKPLLRRRFKDWRARFGDILGKKIYMLNGDLISDINTIRRADIILTTPEKWNAVCRRGHTIESVSLLILDQLQFLASNSGSSLEAMVTRMKMRSSKLRIMALSTPMANSNDVAEWLDVKQGSSFNFKPTERPVPLQIVILGFSGKYYHNRAAAMNKPIYLEIKATSKKKPAIVFVASKKQTSATAFELIAFLRSEKDPKMWLHDMTPEEIADVCKDITDDNLKLSLTFGVGIHHTSLSIDDRRTVEQLYRAKHIQVLVATKNLAWATDLRARFVVVKGTEQYDAKSERYANMPVTDILQMVGRAGRHSDDSRGSAMVLVHDVKEHYYNSVLKESAVAIESGHSVDSLAGHVNAEIAEGKIASVLDVERYLNKTFFYSRLSSNPSFYGVEDSHTATIRPFRSTMAEEILMKLMDAECINTKSAPGGTTCEPTALGKIAAEHYVQPGTVLKFRRSTRPTSLPDCLQVLSEAEEFSGTPVRSDEATSNRTLCYSLPRFGSTSFLGITCAHSKAYLLLQAHVARADLPSKDYTIDTRTILDRIGMLIDALVEVSANKNSLSEVLLSMRSSQSIMQARWADESPLLTLPHVTRAIIPRFTIRKLDRVIRNDELLSEVISKCEGSKEVLQEMLQRDLDPLQIEEIWSVLGKLPTIRMDISISDEPTNTSFRRHGSRPLPTSINKERLSTITTTAEAGQGYIIHINLRQRNKGAKRMSHTPRYPKQREVGWWVVLGETSTNSILAWKRIEHIFGRTSVALPFKLPERKDTIQCSLHLVSDCYIGIDSEIQIPFQVKSF
nr:activating signal cointegrator 1 complex subunit 3-like [Lytechinus pictus]